MAFLLRITTFAAAIATGAAAQEAPPAAVNEAALPTPATCGAQAAVYARDKGPKLWVIRRGTLVLAENPLRPLSRDEAVVLEVVVNGRRATAWGPDADHLRQGASVKSIEAEGREPVRWVEKGAMPTSLRVVSEDGSIILGPLPFGGCEDAPAAKAIAETPARREKPARAAKKAAEESDRPLPGRLPQGALDGLSLPDAKPRR